MSALPSPEVDPADEVPLSIEPVLGWRVWRLAREEGDLRLKAVMHPATWTPQEATIARCSRGVHEGAPLASCTCGYYAASSIENLTSSGVFVRGVGVIGAIAMWGTVIEHQRGARSEYAYPARLRLVCSPCLQSGSIVDPISVFEDVSLIPVCSRHLRSHLGGNSSAATVQAELLATYGVELLPRPRLPRLTQVKPSEISPAKVLGWVLVGILQVIKFVIGAVFALWMLGAALGVIAIVVGDVVGAVSGPASPSPSPLPAAISPDLAPDLAPARAHPHRVVEPHRGPPPSPVVPGIAAPCGIGHGERVELVPCGASGMDLLGISQRSTPKGERRDCLGAVDAYSRGAHWWICWIALPGAWIEHEPISPNPYTAPKNVGGVW